MAFDGSAIPIKQDYRFVNGYPAVEVGKTYQVIPDWVESEKKTRQNYHMGGSKRNK